MEYLTIEDVMSAFLEASGLTHEGFAHVISARLDKKVARGSVTHWCSGRVLPRTDLLLECAALYKGWIRSWALACLKVKLPEVFGNGLVTFR